MRRVSELRDRLRSLTLTPETEGAFDDALRRRAERKPRDENRIELAFAVAFAATCGALLAMCPPAGVPVGTAALLVAALALLSRVEIALASGYAVPTDLA